jgi:uncharacterized Fe-S cluster-containing radical SAM superfamily protein
MLTSGSTSPNEKNRRIAMHFNSKNGTERNTDYLETINYNSSLPLVIYGASDFFAKGTYNRFISNSITPVAFCDKDKRKWNAPAFTGGPIVLSLDKIRELYPNCQFYVSLTQYFPARFSILQYLYEECGLDKSRIINFYEYEKDDICTQIHGFLGIGNNLSFCRLSSQCSKHKEVFSVPYSPHTETFENRLNDFFSARQKFIDNKLNVEYCEKCAYHQNSLFPKKNQINMLDFRTVGRLCNIKCCYCSTWQKPSQINKISNPCDIMRFLEYKGLISTGFTVINWANNEICLNPYRDAFLDYISDYFSIILTNGTIFDDKIYNLLRNGMCLINISVDAGTQETYAKVKNADLFDVLCENLVKYSQANGSILLKYIILPELNDNKRDIYGFLELCKKVNPIRIRLSRDYHSPPSTQNSDILGTVDFMLRLFKSNGFKIDANEFFIYK